MPAGRSIFFRCGDERIRERAVFIKPLTQRDAYYVKLSLYESSARVAALLAQEILLWPMRVE